MGSRDGRDAGGEPVIDGIARRSGDWCEIVQRRWSAGLIERREFSTQERWSIMGTAGLRTARPHSGINRIDRGDSGQREMAGSRSGRTARRRAERCCANFTLRWSRADSDGESRLGDCASSVPTTPVHVDRDRGRPPVRQRDRP